jgi:hypothetical protein
MAMDGDVPPMNSPTYNGLIQVSKKDAQRAIRISKNCLNIQMPFPYAHMLATLVHINNYVLAVICGITMGSAIGRLHQVLAVGAQSCYVGRGHIGAFKCVMTELSDPVQLMFSQLLVVLLIPFFYQTFLQIAAFMCSPVNHDEFALPIASFVKRIEKDLAVQAELAENPPGWTAPSFRPKAQPSASASASVQIKKKG